MRVGFAVLFLLLGSCEERPTRLDATEANATGAIREVIALKARVDELEVRIAELEYRLQ